MLSINYQVSQASLLPDFQSSVVSELHLWSPHLIWGDIALSTKAASQGITCKTIVLPGQCSLQQHNLLFLASSTLSPRNSGVRRPNANDISLLFAPPELITASSMGQILHFSASFQVNIEFWTWCQSNQRNHN